ncbi:DUF4197 domain-containing protein [Niabella beijingensis]|uniref:DUF4197 domain-containing protein n=1 Tax=Niabella beijingensis TaxID=2872700 RepID=UPI001CBB624B|nr:DUF4197 domain-containing protein [Niabella beijingensis]MBZ4190664.1 DUF4197 domain-containing protein [Niabella beijingensis]
MKRLLFSLTLGVSVLFSGCDTLQSVAGGLSQLEMANGLRAALTQGLFSGFDAFANPNQGNPLVRFAFPGDAAKIEKTLRDLGLSSLVNQMTSKFTNAMGQAVTEAKPVFLNAVKNMSIADAASILLTNNRRAATDFFKAQMSPELMSKFRPIVDNTVRTSGADKDYQTLAKAYNAIPFTSKKLETSLNDFIAARAIDGMFLYVASEEEKIRTNLSFRKTDLLKRVFGYADQQMRLRGGQ